MNILLVYPEYPNSFWSFKHALKFINKGASFPPLGLLTAAALLPKEYNKKLIDMNFNQLTVKDVEWADLVFISAMSIQSRSAGDVIKLCISLNKQIVAGGPHFTSSPGYYPNVDYLVLNEAEITLPLFLSDYLAGKAAHIYTTDEKPDITATPLPEWDLISINNYSSLNIQYSRGCPYDCEFCDITVLYGRKPRTKTKQQVIAELNAVYKTGWKGPVFFVDDNFIGNKSKLKKEILPAMSEWMNEHNSPFYFNTEATLNLAEDDELLHLMTEAGFEAVFIGIESPKTESLIECNKITNSSGDMLRRIKKIQQAGLEVQGGFILGFDNDDAGIFKQTTDFIQKSGIVTAMVGLLNAPKGSRLEKRLINQGRLVADFTGSNTDFSINFKPVMDLEALVTGYKNTINFIYSPEYFYERAQQFIKEYMPAKKKVFHLNSNYIIGLIKSVVKLGILGEERRYYWKLFIWTLVHKPRLFSLAILYTIYGFHFRKVAAGNPQQN